MTTVSACAASYGCGAEGKPLRANKHRRRERRNEAARLEGESLNENRKAKVKTEANYKNGILSTRKSQKPIFYQPDEISPIVEMTGKTVRFQAEKPKAI